jgi:hypothetical protein
MLRMVVLEIFLARTIAHYAAQIALDQGHTCTFHCDIISGYKINIYLGVWLLPVTF